MRTAKEIFEIGIEELRDFDVKPLLARLSLANSGAKEDVENINGCAYYQWTSGLVKKLKFSQIIELGGAMGVWTICASHYLPNDSTLYSITLPEYGLDFAYIPHQPDNVHLIRGDDRNLDNWKGVDLSKTDIWFFDTGIADNHFAQLLRDELKLYTPFFKDGAILLFDDIHKNKEMEEVWKSITWDKYDATDPLHYSGFGIAVYDSR